MSDYSTIPLLAFVDGTALLSTRVKRAFRTALRGDLSITVADMMNLPYTGRSQWLTVQRQIGASALQDLQAAVHGNVCGDIRTCERCGMPFVTRQRNARFCSYGCQIVRVSPS